MAARAMFALQHTQGQKNMGVEEDKRRNFMRCATSNTTAFNWFLLIFGRFWNRFHVLVFPAPTAYSEN